MPKLSRLNKRQLAFVDEIMKGTKQTEAAVKAGFAQSSAGRHAHDLMRNPMIIEEIEKRQKLQEEEIRKAFLYDAYKAQRLLSKMVEKEEAYDRDRIKAAEGILDRAGFRAIETPKINNSTTNVLSGLTEEQLLKLIDNN